MKQINMIILLSVVQVALGQELRIKYFTEDSLMRQEYYVKSNTDSLHGESKFFNADGILIEHREYHNDRLWNVIAICDESGQTIVDKGSLKDGNGTVFIYEAGVRRTICTYRNGLKHGQYISFYENSVVKETGNYFNGIRCGVTFQYLRNGQLEHHQSTTHQIDCQGNESNWDLNTTDEN